MLHGRGGRKADPIAQVAQIRHAAGSRADVIPAEDVAGRGCAHNAHAVARVRADDVPGGGICAADRVGRRAVLDPYPIAGIANRD